MVKIHKQSGQVAVMVLLIMTVTLVIALSLARSTTTEISQVAKGGETVRIFSAAESKTEQILTQIISAIKINDNDAIAQLIEDPASVVEGVGEEDESENSYDVVTSSDLNVTLASGEISQVQLTDQDGVGVSTTLTFLWGKTEDACSQQASILIGRYYNLGAGIKVAYTGVGPKACEASRNNSDGFDTAALAPLDSNFANQYSLNVLPTDLYIRVLGVYNSTELVVRGDASLPTQQYQVRTETLNLQGTDSETQAVSAVGTTLHFPMYLDYAVYSGGDLVK